MTLFLHIPLGICKFYLTILTLLAICIIDYEEDM